MRVRKKHSAERTLEARRRSVERGRTKGNGVVASAHADAEREAIAVGHIGAKKQQIGILSGCNRQKKLPGVRIAGGVASLLRMHLL